MTLEYAIVKLKEPVETVLQMKVGVEYVVPRGWLVSKFTASNCTLVSENVDEVYRPIDLTELKRCNKNAKILLMRTSGFGDQMWVSACARYLFDHHGKNISSITMGCLPEYRAAIDYVPQVRYTEAPLTLEQWKTYDYHVCFAGIIDGCTVNKENVYELFLASMGVDVAQADMTKYGRPWLHLANSIPNPFKVPTVILQAISAGSIRDLPISTVIALLHGLELRGYQTVIPIDVREERSLFAVSTIKKHLPGYGTSYFFSPDITPNQDPRLETLLPYLDHAEWIIGTDSSFCHFAEGLGIPAITVFGPFSAESRVKHYQSVVAIDRNPSCRCARHTEGYCSKGFVPAPCLRIDPADVFKIMDAKPNLRQAPTGASLLLI